MDIFSHGLWTAAAAEAFNLKFSAHSGPAERKTTTKKPLNVGWAAFWGFFPDIFAFAIPFTWLFGNILFGDLSPADIPRPEAAEPPLRNNIWVFKIASSLYNVSHSGIVFIAAFLLIWLLFRRPVWELGGWLLHILMDIPTHSYRFYPTPVLWPLSDWKFDGFSWGVPWFMVLNYSALAIVYVLLWRKKKKTPLGLADRAGKISS